MSIANDYKLHIAERDLEEILTEAEIAKPDPPDPQALAQECIMIFDAEFKLDRARITNTGAIRIDSGKFGQFYLKSELLRATNHKEYWTMRNFLLKKFSA